MAVDYLSALNVGSGLNVTQIVDALVDAEKVPQESRIQKQLDERNVSISSLGDVKSDLDIFKSNLDVYKNETGLVTETSNNAAVGVTNNGKIAVQPFTHSVSVNQLATSHTLAFLGYTADTDLIAADTIQIELGTWDSSGNFTPDPAGTGTTITVDASNNTLQSFADAVNSANIGVTANVVRIDENSYALSMISPTGEARQIRVSALSGGSTVHSLSYNDAITHASKQISAGRDADFTLDGLAITRNTNSVDDIVNGMTIELKQETTNPVGIGANYDKEQALTNLTDFVTDLNFMINKLTELTYRGSPGGDDAGPLADDTLVKGYLRSFKRMTTTPLPGFQDQTLYLSNFGVMTELDGSVSINETKFEEFFTANPDAFSAITNTRAVSDSNLVQAELSGNLWKTGTYEFDKLTSTTAQLYKLDENGARIDAGHAMTFEGGKFKITGGDARGLALTMLGNGEDAKIFIGKSLMQTIQEFTENILKPNNDIDVKIQGYNDDITEFNENITDLTERMANQRERYMEQFTAMESSVASFKKTGDLLTNFMDSWRASLKG
jgi:flagellar hook-associated protein 2